MSQSSDEALPADRSARWGVLLLLVIPPLLWAGNFIVGRAIRNDIPPVTLTLARWTVALACLLPFAWPYVRRDARRYLEFPVRIVAVSLSGVAAFSLLTYFGLHHTSGTNALLLNSCVPVLILLFAALFYRQPLHWRQVVGLAVSLGGVLTIIFRGDIAGLLTLSFASGDLLLLGAMASFALYTLWLRKLPPDIHRLGLLAVQIAITLLVTFPLGLWEWRAGATAHWTPATLTAVAYLGVGPSLVSYLLYGRCVETIGAARAGLSIHLIPVFGVALSALFLGERVQTWHLAGIAAILTGITLASVKGRR